MRIIYEDDRLLLAEKPAGVQSQPGGKGEDMLTLLSAYRSERGEEAVIHPLHRLDRDVGGLMVFAKDAKAAACLSTQIQSGAFYKEYLAVIHGVPDAAEGDFVDLLYHDTARNKTYVVKRERRGVRKAHLTYRVPASAEHKGEVLSLVSAVLHTGRTHQVRVQFGSRKHPLWGDRRYGAAESGEIALWCHTLGFTHPDGSVRRFTLPPPECFPWGLFSTPTEQEVTL